jgi:hypothetical protein
VSAKNKDIVLNQLGPDRFEIKEHGRFGLAKLQDGEWLVSPNMSHKADLILKMIRDVLATQVRHE